MDEAEASNFEKFRIGAIIFKGPRILSTGRNALRGCSTIPPRYRKWENSLHAEQAAIKNCSNWEKLKGSSILVVRINNQGQLMLAKPCYACMDSIDHVGIKNVFFSTNDGEIVRLKK